MTNVVGVRYLETVKRGTLRRLPRIWLLLPALLMIGAVMVVFEVGMSASVPLAIRVEPGGTVSFFHAAEAGIPLAAPSTDAAKAPTPESLQRIAVALAERINSAALLALGTTLLFLFVTLAVAVILGSMIAFQCVRTTDQVFDTGRFKAYCVVVGLLVLFFCIYLFPNELIGWTGLVHWGAFVAVIIDFPVRSLQMTSSILPASPNVAGLMAGNFWILEWSAKAALVVTVLVSSIGMVTPLANAGDLPASLKPHAIAHLDAAAAKERIRMGVELLQRRLSNLQRTLQLASAACFFALIWLFSLTSIPGALMGTVLKAEDPLVTFAANFSTSVTFFWVTIYFTVVLGALVPAVVWINFKLRAFYRHDPRTKQAEGDATFTEWMKANQFSLDSFNFFGVKEGAAILAPFVPILLARLGTALPLLTG